MSLTEDRRTAYRDRQVKDTAPVKPCSLACLCRRSPQKWQAGDPTTGLPTAEPWTPGGQR